MKKALKKKYQFYATPEAMADELVSQALDPYQNKTIRILEPSAGQGDLINAIHRWHVDENIYLNIDSITAVEMMDDNISHLQTALNHFGKPHTIVHGDFLKYDESLNYFDYVIANPPFTDGQDLEHFKKMYELCKPGGSVTSIMSVGWVRNISKKYREFRDWLNIEKPKDNSFERGYGSYVGSRASEHGYDEVVSIKSFPAGTFKSSGTNTVTCILQLQKNDISGWTMPPNEKGSQMKMAL